MAKNKRKKEYKELYNGVREIFIRTDPMGLIEGGSPNDEYDSEVSKILPELKHCNDMGDLQSIILNVFKDQFDVKATSDDFYDIADEIFQLYINKTV